MSIREVTMYQVVCDWPGCSMGTPDLGDFHAWASAGQALDEAGNAFWHFDRDDYGHYCYNHKAVWASDYENGEPFPERPFLLIHDGDTDNPDDDGKVTLIEAAP